MPTNSKSSRLISLTEVAIFYLVAHLVIWGSVVWRPPVLLIAFVLIGICVGSNRYHRDSMERIGLSKTTFIPVLKILLPIAIPILALLILMSGQKEMRLGWDVWFSLLGYPIWGFAQQYALLGFVGNRLQDGFGGSITFVPWINGALFSMAHLPNPMLMAATFVGGVVFTWVFFRHRNLFALALIHALFGVVLSLVSSNVEGLMSVGPAYLSRVGHWF